MPRLDPINTLRWTAPVVALLGWILLLFFSMNAVMPGTGIDPSQEFLAELSMVVFLLSTMVYYRLHMRRMVDAHITDYIRIVLYTGMIVVAFTLVFEFSRIMIERSNIQSKLLLDMAIFRLNTGLVMIFLVRTFYIWRSLIVYKASSNTRRLWRVFEFFTLAAIMTIFYKPRIFDFWFLVPASIPVGLAMVLSFNLRWVAYLKTREKWETILLFVLVVLILVYFQRLLRTSVDLPAAAINPVENAFVLFLYVFIALYSVVSLLVILFNIPTSGVVERKIIEASSLQKLSQEIDRSQKEEEIYELFLQKALQVTSAKDGFFEVWNEESKLKERVLKNIDSHLANLSKAYAEMTPGDPREYIFMRFNNLPEEYKVFAQAGYKSMLLISMKSKKGRIGTLGLFNKENEYFDQEAVETAVALSQQAAMSIQSFRFEKESIYNERYREELKVARKVQENLMPKHLSAGEKFEVAFYFQTADDVGGDYFDIEQLDKDCYGVLMADVSGKGTTAAFNMAQLKGVFHSLATKANNPVSFLAEANRALSSCLESSSFITAVYGVLDTAQLTFTYARAGHCPPIHYRHSRKTAHLLKVKGLGLGAIRTQKYVQYLAMETVQLEPQDKLLFFTDGIVEARNSDGEEFGYDRLAKLMEKNGSKSTDRVLELTRQDLGNFTGGKAIDDDYTFLALGVKTPE